jgi:hypothetical protein
VLSCCTLACLLLRSAATYCCLCTLALEACLLCETGHAVCMPQCTWTALSWPAFHPCRLLTQLLKGQVLGSGLHTLRPDGSLLNCAEGHRSAATGKPTRERGADSTGTLLERAALHRQLYARALPPETALGEGSGGEALLVRVEHAGATEETGT